MSRGFKEVKDESKQYKKIIEVYGKVETIYPKTILPIRADKESAGYDFSTPINVLIMPGETKVIWTNVKAYMEPDEVLQVFVRSSIGIKKGIVLANGTGIIDASYYENESNDGNIGLALKNTTGQAIELNAGERIGQGIFTKYLIADEDKTMNDKRIGGIGSSGK